MTALTTRLNGVDDYKYNGPAPVNVRDKVTLVLDDDTECTATVRVVLASQFIAHIPRGGAVFRLFKDKGVTWT